MSAAVKLAAQLPKDTRWNGLDAGELLADPQAEHVAVVVFGVHQVVESIADGSRVPVIRVIRVQPLDGEAETSALRLLRDAANARAGQLEFDDED